MVAIVVLFVVTVLCPVTRVFSACDPEPVIINELPRMGSGWSGSVAWYNGKIYEVADNTSYALVKDPVTGAHEDTISFGSWAADDTKGFTYDPFRGTFWCKVGQYAYEVAVTGGNYLSRINVNSGGFAFGIWCDPDEENVMWVADPVYEQVRKLNMLTGEVLQYVNTDFNVRGVSRAGDTLWCVRAGEPGDRGVIIQIDMDGNELCKYFLPREKYDHDAGGCDIDPDGYLWVEGGKETAIYQLDIGYIPTTPTPATSPTPAAPVMDSGDYTATGFRILLYSVRARVFGQLKESPGFTSELMEISRYRETLTVMGQPILPFSEAQPVSGRHEQSREPILALRVILPFPVITMVMVFVIRPYSARLPDCGRSKVLRAHILDRVPISRLRYMPVAARPGKISLSSVRALVSGRSKV